MIPASEACEAIEDAWYIGLYGAEWFARLGVSKVASACNGCGPEWMSQSMRDGLSRFLDIFSPAFCIHDCRFIYDNNGTRGAFDAANEELRLNCLLLADDKYGWYDPRRYIWRHRARIVFVACRDFGWSAWRDAYGESQKKGQNK